NAPLVSVNFRGTRVGDALTLLGQSCGLRFLPDPSGALLVTLAPSVTVGGAANQPATINRMTNPWSGWSEITGLPLTAGGDTGYPALAAQAPAPGSAGGASVVAIACGRCGAPMLPTWAFCPYCGHQRLVPQRVGKFCPTCGRAYDAPAPDSGASNK
ncbi:MAG: zinc ribbon domain-containing protein, partial [Armatimonadota bacterium]|nr:zinc ribbon domain-containing protein [Armatimonadota bacterium]